MYQLSLRICRCLGGFRLNADPGSQESDLSSVEYTAMASAVLVFGLAAVLSLLRVDDTAPLLDSPPVMHAALP